MKHVLVNEKQTVNCRLLFSMFLIVTTLCCSCKGEQQQEINVQDAGAPPQTTKCLQPMGKFSQKEAQNLKAELQQHIAELGLGNIKGIKVLPNKPLAGSLMNDTRTRYRADKIIRSLQVSKSENRTIIALTHKDISVPLKGKKDWGVLGLSLRPGTACVASTFRCKNKADFWKVVMHEFCHTYYNMPHCPNDDSTCIMKDAKGHANFSVKNRFCKDCIKRPLSFMMRS